MTDSIEASKTVVPIAESERQIALEFAAQQLTCEKARQVYLNTLAVLTVKHCLDLVEIATDLAGSDSWNPFCRLGADLADLKVEGAGYLECRPVAADRQECFIPPEALENRIGYLVVQLTAPYQEATLLGFVPQTVQINLPLSQLQPISNLFLHLENLSIASQPTVNLRQWLHNAVETTWQNAEVDAIWQTVEDVLSGTPQPRFAFRKPRFAFRKPRFAFRKPRFAFRNINLKSEEMQKLIEQMYASQYNGSGRLKFSDKYSESQLKSALIDFIGTTPDEALRWKAVEILWVLEPEHPAAGVRRIMDLGLLLAGQQLALLVAVVQSRSRSLSVLARVYPLREQRYVPTELQLSVLSADDSSSCKVQARERDNYIQLILRAEFDDRFSIRITLKENSITEYFVV